MSKIHFLQVKHGDAFILECNRSDNNGIIVVDGGPSGCSYILSGKLKELGQPDLLILTHYDDDHIGGILQYIKECLYNGTLPSKEIWANCAGYVDFNANLETSARDGAVLSSYLDDFANKGMIWKDDICEGYNVDFPFASIEIISPTKDVRKMAIKKQEDERDQTLLTKATQRTNADLATSLEKLSEHNPKEPDLTNDSQLANAASVALILRCDGFSILMLGDTYPQNVEAYLRAKGYSEETPLEVDYVKVSHHGSRNNISNSLLDIIKCNNFLISTNGGKGIANHPDRIAIAHILCHPKRNYSEKVHLFFNHSVEIIEANGAPFFKAEEKEIYNFEIHENITEI